MTGTVIYIIGCLVNIALVKMAEKYYEVTNVPAEEIDERALTIALAMSFISTPFIYLQFRNEIEWTWKNFINK